MAHSPRGRKKQLVIVIVLGLVAVGAMIVWLGMAELRRAAQERSEQVATEFIHIELNVPGTTTVQLGPQTYSIWLQGDDLASLGGDDLAASDLPPVRWKVSGPRRVEISDDVQVRVENYRLAGTFSIEAEGEYQFVATLPDVVENRYIYNIGDDPSPVIGEVLVK